MPLIWGFEQRQGRAADWHDGQIAHGAHAHSARRATSLRGAKQSRNLALVFPGCCAARHSSGAVRC